MDKVTKMAKSMKQVSGTLVSEIKELSVSVLVTAAATI